MRLTTVTQMSLPAGRLSSYVLEVAETEGAELPISFDQARHVGEGERDGSWMAISFRIPEDIAPADLARSWHDVIDRHGTLRSVFSRTSKGALRLSEVDIIGGEWVSHPIAPRREPRDQVRRLFDEACRVFARPSYRLAVLTPDTPSEGGTDARPVVIIGADHAHVDMWSLLVVTRDLMVSLDPSAVAVPSAEDPPSFAEHSALLQGMPPAPPEVFRRWSEILATNDGAMPTFPLPLGDVATPTRAIVEVRDVLSVTERDELEERSRARGVRMTAVALAALTDVTLKLSGAPLRAVFPVHSRLEPRWHDGVGWFITNSVIECTVAEPEGCGAAMKEALRLGSHPLAPIFAPMGGMPAGPGMFALSWLDTRRLPQVGDDWQIQCISAAVDTDGVMAWFIVADDGLHVRCRYPDTPEARENVGAWLDGVEGALQAAVAMGVARGVAGDE